MSSHTAPALEAVRSDLRSQNVWNDKDVVLQTAALIASFTFTVYPAHRSIHSLVIFSTLSLAVLAAFLLPQRFPVPQISPMEIDRTVRLLRGFGFGLAIVVVSAFAFSPAEIPAFKLFLYFVGSLAIARTSIRARQVEVPDIASDQPPVQVSKAHARVKRSIDVLISGIALAVLSPLLIVIAIAVKLDSPGPILFSHQRVGHRGKRFWILKFRTMYVQAPKYQRSPSTPEDARITRVGRVLRRLSIDEVPQLVNVLFGEMSLVGPRPEMPYITKNYTTLQRKRFAVLPGITGLWQISPARAFPIHQHIEYDLYYIARQSVLLDLAILCRTTASVVRGIGAT